MMLCNQIGNEEQKTDTLAEKNIYVRAARLTDVDGLENIIAYWANQGEHLPRARNELVRHIGSFAVACFQNEVIGCASLYIYDSGLAEIRSLGIKENWQARGLGADIVHFLLAKAQDLAIRRVFVLTRVANFFVKQGFAITDRALLPEKIYKDCSQCPRRNNCDEIALDKELSQSF